MLTYKVELIPYLLLSPSKLESKKISVIVSDDGDDDDVNIDSNDKVLILKIMAAPHKLNGNIQLFTNTGKNFDSVVLMHTYIHINEDIFLIWILTRQQKKI